MKLLPNFLVKAIIKKLQILLDRYPEKIISVKDKSKFHPKVNLLGVKLYGDLEIDEGTTISGGVKIFADSKIKIGKYNSINGPNTDIFSLINPIIIGNFNSIARNVTIQEYNHKTNYITTYCINKNIFKIKSLIDYSSVNAIEIGNDVWIGSQCIILSGAKIGDGVIIAANSTVNGYIPDYAIAAGSPAKVIKFRFSEEIINKLLVLKWWYWPLEKIIRNKKVFASEVTLELLNSIQN